MSDVLVVIGAGGMGEAIARRSGTGRTVLLADYDPAVLERVRSRMEGDGYQIVPATVDVSSHASVADLAQQAAALGDVRQVAHTAGVSAATATPEAILAVDLAGVAYSLEEFGMVIASGGAGVYIASMAGTLAAPYLPGEVEQILTETPADDLLTAPFVSTIARDQPAQAYGIAKRANQLRTQAASHQWGRRGARVNSISPGVISTPMGRAELDGEAGAFMRLMIENSALGRLGTPGDIAAAAGFLLGPDSAFISGTDLLVDGGVVAAIRSGRLPLPTGAF
ncbi:SDR family oxidoreductase [Microbacterium aurum]